MVKCTDCKFKVDEDDCYMMRVDGITEYFCCLDCFLNYFQNTVIEFVEGMYI